MTLRNYQIEDAGPSLIFIHIPGETPDPREQPLVQAGRRNRLTSGNRRVPLTSNTLDAARHPEREKYTIRDLRLLV
jgi:hypothetical protein